MTVSMPTPPETRRRTDNIDRNIIITVLILTALCIGLTLGATHVEGGHRLTAASTECAQFNPQTGKFEWLGR